MNYYRAILDFRRARRQAARERLMARLRGKSVDLLSYDKIRQMLKAKSSREVGLRDIPLDAIVGSVGRYADFTRSFLPLHDETEPRWARIQLKATDMEGLPPITVYQIGDVYFVADGHHRVSVARQLGATHIQAYVTQIETKVPIGPDIQPEDLILKAEYAGFLEHTHLDEIRPEADLSVTVTGQYPLLEEHIQVHRYFMGLEQQREVPYAEAVGHWYDTVYMPVVRVIREQDILVDFPGRTEADLYLWIAEHRAVLEEELGWEIEAEAAAADLVEGHSPKPQRRFARVVNRMMDALTPDELEAGPQPGTWRRGRQAAHRDDRLFSDILVPVSGEEQCESAVAQAIELARRERARLMGLHVASTAAEPDSEKIQDLQAYFLDQCQAAGVEGRFAIETGQVSHTICERSHWTDLIVIGLAHPPAPQRVARLGSGFRKLIRRCPTPILAVPGAFSPLNRPLLAYDGSSKAREALYIATYLAARGELPLVVVTVIERGQVTPDTLAEVGGYLEACGVQATLILEQGGVAEAILRTAREHQCDLILLGGYGHSPVVEAVLGSAVDEVLRESSQPILLCR